MPNTALVEQLAEFGPDRQGGQAVSLPAARAYCRRLAGSHYENFTVVSWLLPRRLRQHFYHVYAYCRWADDLADETGDPTQSLMLLDWWEAQVVRCYEGQAEHPVFVALAETIREFDIPQQPFLDLLVAFRRDQQQTRYETFDELLDYCRSSANPVGRLILYLGRCHDRARGELADAICTGLQLANFWQDVARDWDRGRIYLPQEDCRACGYDEASFERRETNAAFRRLMADNVDRAEEYLRRGLPLCDRVPSELRIDVELFARGGLEVTGAIRRIDFDVWRTRPVVTKWAKLRLLAGSLWRRRVAPGTGDAA